MWCSYYKKGLEDTALGCTTGGSEVVEAELCENSLSDSFFRYCEYAGVAEKSEFQGGPENEAEAGGIGVKGAEEEKGSAAALLFWLSPQYFPNVFATLAAFVDVS